MQDSLPPGCTATCRAVGNQRGREQGKPPCSGSPRVLRCSKLPTNKSGSHPLYWCARMNLSPSTTRRAPASVSAAASSAVVSVKTPAAAERSTVAHATALADAPAQLLSLSGHLQPSSKALQL